MSADLQWMIVRNNSCFLQKSKLVTFSREPNNLKNKNSFRYNGLVNNKTVGIEGASDGKGVVMITRNKRKTRRPNKAFNRIELKKDARRTFATIRKVLRSNNYRKDLKMVAVRRASAILRSQKPVIPRKQRGKKKE